MIVILMMRKMMTMTTTMTTTTKTRMKKMYQPEVSLSWVSSISDQGDGMVHHLWVGIIIIIILIIIIIIIVILICTIIIGRSKFSKSSQNLS